MFFSLCCTSLGRFSNPQPQTVHTGDVFSRDYSNLDHLSIYSFSIYAINDAGTGEI